MAKKSDRWIKAKSYLEHFFVIAIARGEERLFPSFPLETVLSMGVDINQLASSLQAGPVVSFNSWKGEPSWQALREKLQADYGGKEIVELRFEALQGAVPQDPSSWNIPLPLVYPFFNQSVSTLEYRGKVGKCPSFGLTSYGYDIRLGNKFKICHGKHTPGKRHLLDFLTCDDTPNEDHLWEEIEADAIDLLPDQFMLAVSMEWVNMPNNAIATCMQKSSLARKGNAAFVTPLEPGWRGYITLEIKNDTEVTQRLYAGMGIMQLGFEEGDERCEVSYADRGGKYMNQGAVPVLSKTA